VVRMMPPASIPTPPSLRVLCTQHEIRGYNRLGMMARSELLVMMQDDDVPRSNPDWLRNATRLFAKYPRMGMLGAYRGRMDDGTKKKPNNSNDGSKYGAEPGKDVLRVTKRIPFREPELQLPFMWIYKVNMGPLFVRTQLRSRNRVGHC
jgi:hypothetical protein